MSQTTSDNNAEMIALIKAIGQTPGFRLADAKSGNFKAVRNELNYDGHHVPESSRHLSIRTKNQGFLDTVKKLEEDLGWSQQLHDDLKAISRDHRVKETDPTRAITERLLTAFKPGWDTPEPEAPKETPEQRRERIRHDKIKAQGPGRHHLRPRPGAVRQGRHPPREHQPRARP
jgi:hypothetical protein